ncbi:acyltransferase, partial [Streptomyces sp. SID11233]|nr:acyltransferase [Streptomyces sp. SID11233]
MSGTDSKAYGDESGTRPLPGVVGEPVTSRPVPGAGGEPVTVRLPAQEEPGHAPAPATTEAPKSRPGRDRYLDL